MRGFHLTLARIGENVFDGEALSVSLPGSEGVFTVLAGHEAFVSELRAGSIRVVSESGNPESFDVHDNGIAEVSQNQVTVLL